MKKRITALILILAVFTCFLSVTALGADAVKKHDLSSVPFEEVVPEHPEIYTDDEIDDILDGIFGEDGKYFIVIWVAMVFGMGLFMPALILVIVFAVFNSNTKKKIKEYERMYGSVLQNSVNYNQYYAPNTVYQNSPVNTGAPMGTNPGGMYYQPNNDINNQQGGNI